MAKFAVGQAVEIAFNPYTPDPRVPNQANGRFPGRGEYQKVADRGKVIGLVGESAYMVLVDLVRIEAREGEPYEVKSKRKRIIDEAKLTAV